MKSRSFRLLLILLCLLVFPFRAPAPLIYRPGEGWSYEPVGGEGKWQRARAKEQLDVAQSAFAKKDYGLALKAARRVVKVWPLSDYAPPAQYLVGRCYEAKGQDEKAFREYQKVLQKQPKIANYKEILERQMVIADKYLAGKWFKLWGFIPIFSSMDKTADMYDKIVKNGPYSDVAPQAQLKIGAAREKQKNYALAAKAYESAADRYHDRPTIAAEALYREGVSFHKQAQTAEYDQSTAGQAIATFTDFMTLYPNDSRINDAQKTISSLRHEQARGNLQIAKFYEKYHRWRGAVVYYNEVVALTLTEPNSPYALEARKRIETLTKMMEGKSN
ncbi:MAG TPA: outer membrane protein assembly factor BamD [Candidatus Limnocylindrales bacterium]|jgi:outer membrane protein assembly factor BamD|nr:outer membrane protein assembly factor BamD [Candidatus Limnocylindrales bacterium]